MKLSKRIGFCFLIATLGVLSFLKMEVSASSATLLFSTKGDTIAVGDTFSVILTLESNVLIGDLEAFVSYDQECMEFVSGGSFVTGSDGLLHISDFDVTEPRKTRKFSLKFKAIEAGSCQVELDTKPTVNGYEDGKEMSVSSNVLSVSVQEKKVQLSENANLKSLAVSPGTLSPEFKPEVDSYTIMVSNITKNINVLGIPQDNDATVKVSGNAQLAEGENTITVLVKAPKGNTKKYSILVKRETLTLSANETKNDGTARVEDNGFVVSKKNNKIYMKKEYQYQVIEAKEGVEIPPGYVRTDLTLYGVKMTAYVMERDKGNDFFLLYCKNEEKELGFYQFDRIEKTLQRFNGDIIKRVKEGSSSPKIQPVNEYNSKLTQLAVVIALLSAVCALLLIVVIRMFLKLRGYDEDDLA